MNTSTESTSLLLVAILLVLMSACTQDPPRRVSSFDERAFSTANSLEFDLVAQASKNLDLVNYERTLETLQLTTAGDTAAYERIRVMHENGEQRVVERLTSGVFRRGALARTIAPDVDYTPDSTTFQLLVQSDPVYLSARNRNAFGFSLTRLGAWPAVEVRLRDADEVQTDVRRVVLAFEPRSRQVVAMNVQRRSESWLVRSGTESALVLTQAEDSLWLPQSFAVSQTRDSPLQRPYSLSKTERYDLFRPRN